MFKVVQGSLEILGWKAGGSKHLRQDLHLTEILEFPSVHVDAAVTEAVKSERRMRHKNYVTSKC